jgi:hypothetical protein
MTVQQERFQSLDSSPDIHSIAYGSIHFCTPGDNMKNVLLAAMALPISLAVATPASAGILLSQGFDDITTLASSGWVLTNESSPLGETNWFQGNSDVFGSQSGAANSYISANFNNTTTGGDISNWLITPIFSTETAGVINFWIQGAADAGYQDTIRTGFSTGSSATSDFALSSILAVPQGDWTKVSVSFAAAGTGATGRFAIAYMGPEALADYIGVDTLSIDTTASSVPETATWGMMIAGFGVIGGQLRYRRRRAKVSFT